MPVAAALYSCCRRIVLVIKTDNVPEENGPQPHTVINAFGGLVILRAIAGNITSYSREIYGQLKSLL